MSDQRKNAAVTPPWKELLPKSPCGLSSNGSEPCPYCANNFIDLKLLQEIWLFRQRGTPCGQESVSAALFRLLIRFISDLLDRWFPISQIHRLFPCVAAQVR